MKAYSFKSLTVYIKAKDLVKDIYNIVKLFPLEERYALSDQLRRAVISVPSNIVEGINRMSNKEKSHFLEIAYASLMEVCCQIDIAKDLGFIDKQTNEDLENKINEIGKLISGLRKSILKGVECKEISVECKDTSKKV